MSNFAHEMTKYNTYTLENGLRIIHLPSISQVVYCGYDIAAGTRNELPGEEGLAHFCEHMSFKGTARRNAIQIINAIEGLGGELNAFTNKEDTVYYAAISKEHFSQAVDVLTDIVFHSQYPQDSPAELIYDEFENLLFEGHPLGHNILGNADQLRTYTTADALRFVQRNYRTDRMVFFVYGDINFKQLCRNLGHLTPNGENPSLAEPSIPSLNTQKKAQFIEQKRSTHQAHVMTGCQAYAYNDPRRLTLYLLNNILGGPGMNARLNLSLRERHGLVYTVESTMATYGDTGIWSIYFGCDHHDISRCRRLVRHELDRLMQKPLSQQQLIKAKRQLKGQLAIACDNREQFALDFGRSYLHHGHERDLDTLFRHIDAISAEELQAVACDLFDPQNMTTLIFK